MNKILLELSEKEVDFLKEVIELEKVSVDKSESGYEEKERKTGICNSFLSKVELACQPQTDVLITLKDLFKMVSLAKGEYQTLGSDLHISNKKVEESDFKHISLANSVIMWLNSRNLIKKHVRFDYTDSAFQYEEME